MLDVQRESGSTPVVVIYYHMQISYLILSGWTIIRNAIRSSRRQECSRNSDTTMRARNGTYREWDALRLYRVKSVSMSRSSVSRIKLVSDSAKSREITSFRSEREINARAYEAAVWFSAAYRSERFSRLFRDTTRDVSSTNKVTRQNSDKIPNDRSFGSREKKEIDHARPIVHFARNARAAEHRRIFLASKR